MKRILVVGSWAKEQITIENIKRSSFYQVFSYLDTKNPAIIALVDGYCLGSLSDKEAILNYVKKIKPDLTLVTTALPLALGVVDRLEEEGYRVFGPKAFSARLESDKAFTRCLMQKHAPECLPEFKVFECRKEAVEYASVNNFQVAVKPIGLTEGLGVKVFGDQLQDSQQVREYISQILERRKGQSVIIEEKIQGEEFTLQCFVNGEIILPAPCVQDFKKLLEGDAGPNTASMGAYSSYDKLLPFMSQDDYDQALAIIKKTLAAFSRQENQRPCGFLYGQFMITSSGIKLIEYNFRPGDPEWMNTVLVLEDNIAEVAEGLLCGQAKQLTFKKKATVCRYITPKRYPYQLNQTLEVDFSLPEIEQEGVGAYYSCGLNQENKLEVGSERGIAFAAEADSIPEAAGKVACAIGKVRGQFHFRKDIGTEDQVKQRVERVKKIKAGI